MVDKETIKALAQGIEGGIGKEVLDRMIETGYTKQEIRGAYRAINFYPNTETLEYIEANATA
jgi:hypothetical protein